MQSRLTEQELATSQLKQDLVRVTLAKQTLEYEKKELLRRVDELERGLAGVKNENGEKEKHIKAYKQQLEDAIRKQRDFHIAASAAGVSWNFNIHNAGPEKLKKSSPKKVVKSNKSISGNFFFDQIPFFAISKMAKIRLLNWEII